MQWNKLFLIDKHRVASQAPFMIYLQSSVQIHGQVLTSLCATKEMKLLLIAKNNIHQTWRCVLFTFQKVLKHNYKILE